MTRWLGRIGAALLISVALTGIIWLVGAIVIWLDSMIAAPLMMVVATILFAVSVAGDAVYDWLKQREEKRNLYDAERYAALLRADDEL